MLFAAGGVLWESWLVARSAAPRMQWIKPAWVTLMALAGAILAPFVVPVLPVETYIRYSQALGFQPPKIETHKLGPLPQLYADQFGWEEMAAAVAKVYNGLPPEVRPKTAIFGQNYGQAGAGDLDRSVRLLTVMHGVPSSEIDDEVMPEGRHAKIVGELDSGVDAAGRGRQDLDDDDGMGRGHRVACDRLPPHC